MKINAKSLGLVSLFGGLGGGLNAWWCYARFPAGSSVDSFTPWIVPAGFAHGALLALASVLLADFFLGKPLPAQIAGLAFAGWLAGWLSFIPIQLYIDVGSSESPMPFLASAAAPRYPAFSDVVKALRWPFSSGFRDALYVPYIYFGLVAVVYCFLSALFRRNAKPLSLAACMGMCSLSGILGSLWWWIQWDPWYFSLLHGAVWGSLVGYGLWESRKKPAS